MFSFNFIQVITISMWVSTYPKIPDTMRSALMMPSTLAILRLRGFLDDSQCQGKHDESIGGGIDNTFTWNGPSKRVSPFDKSHQFQPTERGGSQYLKHSISSAHAPHPPGGNRGPALLPSSSSHLTFQKLPFFHSFNNFYTVNINMPRNESSIEIAAPPSKVREVVRDPWGISRGRKGRWLDDLPSSFSTSPSFQSGTRDLSEA
jgi:hypothetical protein